MSTTRRTQRERRAETRGKLLDATIRSLIDVGHAGTTTRRIAEAAGVSQGAVSHHFPLRVDLVGAAVERLAEQRVAELRRQAAALPAGREVRVRALLELLWGDVSSEYFTVFVKLWIAAAADAELYARLVPVERYLAREIASSIPAFLADGGAPGDLSARVSVVLATMRGYALSLAYEPTGRTPKDPWPTVRPVLEELLLAR